MTPAMLQLLTGFRERLMQLGQTCLHQRTGVEFRAILTPLPAIIPGGSELGDDPRELATLEARRDHCPAFLHGDLIEQVQPMWRTATIADDFPNPVWKVIRRDNNTVAYAIKYWMVKITEVDPQS
jgi:hypothetical protein